MSRRQYEAAFLRMDSKTRQQHISLWESLLLLLLQAGAGGSNGVEQRLNRVRGKVPRRGRLKPPG